VVIIQRNIWGFLGTIVWVPNATSAEIFAVFGGNLNVATFISLRLLDIEARWKQVTLYAKQIHVDIQRKNGVAID